VKKLDLKYNLDEIITPIGFPGLEIKASDFPNLVGPYQRTKELEKFGFNIFNGNSGIDQLETFIHQVCNWGNRPGIAANVLSHNSAFAIEKAFRNAIIELHRSKPSLSTAMGELNRINYLGKPSFASKHLRFLRADICPVFDDIIVQNSIYDNNEYEYETFAEECLEIAARIERLGIINPICRIHAKWYAAEVEIAIYHYLKKDKNVWYCRNILNW
jgi:hypothetical protein